MVYLFLKLFTFVYYVFDNKLCKLFKGRNLKTDKRRRSGGSSRKRIDDDDDDDDDDNDEKEEESQERKRPVLLERRRQIRNGSFWVLEKRRSTHSS